MAKKTLNSDEMMTAILSYLGILLLIPLLVVKKKDEFIKFHLRQGIVLLIVEVIFAIAAQFFGFLFFLGWIIWPLVSLCWLAILIVSIVAIIKAIQGEMWKIPVISNYTSMIKI
ncbi:MAG: DUF4870 domain-containing protein [Nanoarchaeota archaeon]